MQRCLIILKNWIKRDGKLWKCYIEDIQNIGNKISQYLVKIGKDKESKESFDSKLRTGYQIYKKALQKGVLLRPLGDVIYFNPPLIIENRCSTHTGESSLISNEI